MTARPGAVIVVHGGAGPGFLHPGPQAPSPRAPC